MNLFAEQQQPAATTARRLYIDLDICAEAGCPVCAAQCSYYYHPENNGVRSIAEVAAYQVVCRRCESPHCIAACPTGALEQQPGRGRLLVRHAMRCISCHSCAHACPYGTIYPECVPILHHICDGCLDRRAEGSEPRCVETCPHWALRLAPPELEEDEHTVFVGPYLAVHVTHWKRD